MATRAMATGDFPHITGSTYTSNTYVPGINTVGVVGWGSSGIEEDFEVVTPGLRRMAQHQQTVTYAKPVETEVAEKPKTRFVRVLIVDPDENIALPDRLIFSGDEKLTDLTDQELFFELDIRDLLAKHNEKRIKVVDKAVKERTQYLEPAKIRDLRMVVVNVASF